MLPVLCSFIMLTQFQSFCIRSWAFWVIINSHASVLESLAANCSWWNSCHFRFLVWFASAEIYFKQWNPSSDLTLVPFQLQGPVAALCPPLFVWNQIHQQALLPPTVHFCALLPTGTWGFFMGAKTFWLEQSIWEQLCSFLPGTLGCLRRCCVPQGRSWSILVPGIPVYLPKCVQAGSSKDVNKALVLFWNSIKGGLCLLNFSLQNLEKWILTPVEFEQRESGRLVWDTFPITEVK